LTLPVAELEVNDGREADAEAGAVHRNVGITVGVLGVGEKIGDLRLVSDVARVGD